MSRRPAPLLLVATLALAGCPAVPVPLAAPPLASSTAAPTPVAASTTPAPVAPPTPSPAATATSASPAPSPQPSVAVPEPGYTITVAGVVTDEDGAMLDGVAITIRSLDPSVPYETTTTTTAGEWQVTTIPEGANIEVLATKPGWTPRQRVGSFQQQNVRPKPEVIRFGTPPAGHRWADRDPNGAAYYLSDHPEITATVPAAGVGSVDPRQIGARLTVSEPLKNADRDRLAAAIRLWPAHPAAGAPGAIEAAVGEGKDLGDGLAKLKLDFAVVPLPAAIGYAVGAGTRFLDDDAVRATVSWDATNTIATLTFAAPYVASNGGEARYQLGLVAGDAPIADPAGHQLGSDHEGRRDRYPAAGQLIANAFRPRDVYIPGNAPRSADADWAATHASVVRFAVPRDRTAPTFEAVALRDGALYLTFSEALVAYDGTPAGRVDPHTRDLASYTYDGETPFPEGTAIALQASDPRTVVLRPPAGFFDGRTALKVRAQGVADPAGNMITQEQANQQQRDVAL